MKFTILLERFSLKGKFKHGLSVTEWIAKHFFLRYGLITYTTSFQENSKVFSHVKRSLLPWLHKKIAPFATKVTWFGISLLFI